jgi:hypothetical protein
MDQVLHTDNTVLAEVLLNNLVVGESNALTTDLSIPPLVDELADGLEIWIAIGDVRVDNRQHLRGGLVQANEDAIVDLKETEQLQDLAGLRSNLVDTLNSHNENQSRLVGNVKGPLLSAQTGETDLLALGITVLLNVRLSTLEDNSTLFLVGLLLFLKLGPASGSSLLLALALFKERLGNEDLVLGRDGAVNIETIEVSLVRPVQQDKFGKNNRRA